MSNKYAVVKMSDMHPLVYNKFYSTPLTLAAIMHMTGALCILVNGFLSRGDGIIGITSTVLIMVVAYIALCNVCMMSRIAASRHRINKWLDWHPEIKSLHELVDKDGLEALEVILAKESVAGLVRNMKRDLAKQGIAFDAKSEVTRSKESKDEGKDI